MSRALSTLTTVTPGGSGTFTGPDTSVTAAPAAAAAAGDGVALLAGRAVGDVAHRIDRLVGRPGGHQHALARQRAGALPQAAPAPPRRSPAAPPCGRAPASPLSAISPAFGPTNATPSAASCAMFRCVAPLLAHMCGFIAGASRISWSVASSTAEARSSARPFAIFAIRSAVAGATTIRSASRASRMWPTSNSLFGVEQVGERRARRRARRPTAA